MKLQLPYCWLQMWYGNIAAILSLALAQLRCLKLSISVVLRIQPPQFLFLVAVVVAFPRLACYGCLTALWSRGCGHIALTLAQPNLLQAFCPHVVVHCVRSLGVGPYSRLEQKILVSSLKSFPICYRTIPLECDFNCWLCFSLSELNVSLFN